MNVITVNTASQVVNNVQTSIKHGKNYDLQYHVEAITTHMS